jgi:glyoxylase-like metal-dependent hydrolase (beta-lactamase superfamily II)
MPRLFEEPDSIPGLTWPTITFRDKLTIELGGDRGELVLEFLGRGHTEGDIVAWLPRQEIVFAGDLVESQAALYTGDAFHFDWAAGTLDRIKALGARQLVGGRGEIARGREAVDAAIEQTREFLLTMQRTVGEAHRSGGTLKDAFRATHEALAPKFGHWPIFEHCLPFDVQRLWDELDGIERPVIWTAERDLAVWEELQD